MTFLERITGLLKDPPPSMAFEITEASIAAARLAQKTELSFQPLKKGTIAASPVKDNVLDASAFTAAVRQLSGGAGSRKRHDVALILPDYSARTAVLDFDNFPSDAKEQLSLLRFRLKRSVPFDVEDAVISYYAQPGSGKRHDVVAVLAPVDIVAHYEAAFRSAGMTPGFITTSGLAALELAPEGGITVLAKLCGHVLTVIVRNKNAVKLVRCLELQSLSLEDIAADLFPTFVYVEDNLGAPAEKLLLCGFENETMAAVESFANTLNVEVEPLRSPLGAPGENNAGLLGYIHSLARDN